MKERILRRIQKALEGRPKALLPGPLHPEPVPDPVGLLWERLQANGAEVHRLPRAKARGFIARLLQGLPGAALARGVPEELLPPLNPLPPEEAPMGISYALFAVAETGTVALSSEEGRKAHLLPPVHLVLVEADRVYPSLLEAFQSLKTLPPALGLHSGPSKSADIGQVMVQGVHGPGRLIVALLSGTPEEGKGDGG